QPAFIGYIKQAAEFSRTGYVKITPKVLKVQFYLHLIIDCSLFCNPHYLSLFSYIFPRKNPFTSVSLPLQSMSPFEGVGLLSPQYTLVSFIWMKFASESTSDWVDFPASLSCSLNIFAISSPSINSSLSVSKYSFAD